MAHEITSTDNMLSVREMPWHGLGEVWDHHPTRREAQIAVHNWEPVERPVFVQEPTIHLDGTISSDFAEVPDVKAIQRSDNGETLGVVGNTLGLITNEQMWDVVEAVGNIGSDIKIETAGSLDGGRKVWALLRLTEPLQIKGDPNGATVAYLAFQNGHVGNGAFRAQAINTRIVCANTSAAADVESKKNGYEFTFRHTSKVGDRIEEAKAAVSMWREGVDVWQHAMEHLVTMKVTDEGREEFVRRFQPMPPRHLISDRVANNVETARDQLRAILASQTGEGIHNTAFGLAQAGIEWAHHVRGTKGRDARSRMESRFKRAMLTTDSFGREVIELAKVAATV